MLVRLENCKRQQLSAEQASAEIAPLQCAVAWPRRFLEDFQLSVSRQVLNYMPITRKEHVNGSAKVEERVAAWQLGAPTKNVTIQG